MRFILIACLLTPFDSAGLAFSETRVAHPSTTLGMTLSLSKGQDGQVKPDERQVQRLATEGWTAARELAPKGGPVELLGPVNLRLRQLDEIPNMSARYAEIAIRAAVSAAQEEREELGVLLAHARGLSDQMGIGNSTPPEWPLPIDELEGELWFEVDRFAEARDAYERATKLKPTPNAWIGLARSADRVGDIVTACRAFTAVSGTKNLPATVELEISVYMLKCKY